MSGERWGASADGRGELGVDLSRRRAEPQARKRDRWRHWCRQGGPDSALPDDLADHAVVALGWRGQVGVLRLTKRTLRRWNSIRKLVGMKHCHPQQLHLQREQQNGYVLQKPGLVEVSHFCQSCNSNGHL